VKFRYTATDAQGKQTSGEMEAASAQEVSARLEASGLRVDSVEPLDLQEAAADRAGQRPKSLSGKDFQELSGHISDIAQGDLPLGPGLMALAEEMPKGRIRSGLIAMIQELDSGADLETVLQSQGAPADLRALVRAGVRSGQVGEVLAQYVNHARSVTILRRRALLGIAYPTLLTTVGAALFLTLVAFIVPQFKKIYEDFGTELPGITVLLINLSDVVVYAGIWILVIGIPLCIGAWMFMKWLLGDVLYRRLVCHIPFVGPLLRFCALARFSNLFALLIENKVPMPEALTLAGDGVADAELRAACRNLALDVQNGLPLSRAAYALTGFPASFVQTLTREEHRGALPEALHALAEMFEGRARVQTSFVATICEPFIVVFLGCTIGFLVLALFMPLVKLLNDLS